MVYTPRGTTPGWRSPTQSSTFCTAGAGWPRAGPGTNRRTSSSTNLLAEGKIKPMVVVMPLGYGDMSFVENGFNIWRDPACGRT